jgi:hypothetical protein
MGPRTADTVDSAIPRHSVISAPVIRTLRAVDDPDALGRRAVWDAMRRRRAIQNPAVALGA